MAPPSVVVIEELKGADLKVARRVFLHGSGLPFRGAAWGTKQKLATKWYPGNGTSATQHVLGPEEIPSSWEGEWRTTRLVSTPAVYYPENGTGINVTKASVLRDIVDDIFFLGSLLRVTWQSGPGFKMVRLGRASEWSFPHDRLDDIKWSITFDWTGRGGQQQSVVRLTSSKDAVRHEIQVELNALVQEIQTAKIASINRNVLGSADSFSLGDLEALADAPFALMKQVSQAANLINNRIDHIGKLIEKVETMPATLLSQLQDIAENTKATMNNFADNVSAIVPDTHATAGSSAKLAKLLKTNNYVGQAQQAAEKAAAAAVKAERDVRRRLSALKPGQRGVDKAQPADMLAVHLSKKGDTFITISVRYYKTPDRGGDIAKANGFPIFQVAPPPGSVVIVPNLTALENLNNL